MKAVALALAGALVSVAAFPPFGPGALVFAGMALFLVALRMSPTPRAGLWVGTTYGLAFFGGLMWWLVELELIALVLVPVQAAFVALYGWWLARHNHRGPVIWLLLSVGGWSIMELVRYHFPVGGLEWGALGYALSDNLVTRLPAAAVGTSGLTVIVVVVAAVVAGGAVGRFTPRLLWFLALPVIALVATVPTVTSHVDGPERRVAVIQGSTPCPFEHCPPDERLRTFQQHLALTKTLEPAAVDLVVWSEGSTGSTNADPVLNEPIREAIAAEARRLRAVILVGGDRVVSDTRWINANVYFDESGEIVGEYRKQHPVPFGEYIPLRPLFEWIPALDRVPRDMIRGDGPVVFEDGLGSVISFEGGFSRYALEARREGANVIVVATNEASYGPNAPTSDQFIGMTRMRAVELGVPLVHAAVTGKSTVTDRFGEFSSTTGLGTLEIFQGSLGDSSMTPYTSTGDLVMYLSALAGIVAWSRSGPMVGSAVAANPEE